MWCIMMNLIKLLFRSSLWLGTVAEIIIKKKFHSLIWLQWQLACRKEELYSIKFCIWEIGYALKLCFQTCAAVSAEASSHLKTRHSSLSRCLAMTTVRTSSTECKNSHWPQGTAVTASTCPLLPPKATSKTPSSPSTRGWDYYHVVFHPELILKHLDITNPSSRAQLELFFLSCGVKVNIRWIKDKWAFDQRSANWQAHQFGYVPRGCCFGLDTFYLHLEPKVEGPCRFGQQFT